MPQKKAALRVYYGKFRIRRDHKTIGRAHVSMMYRGSCRVNVTFEVFDRGRYPWFHGGQVLAEGIFVLPLAALKDLMGEVEANGVRIRKNAAHQWEKKRYVRKVKS